MPIKVSPVLLQSYLLFFAVVSHKRTYEQNGKKFLQADVLSLPLDFVGQLQYELTKP